MRGKVATLAKSMGGGGITPAYAGKRYSEHRFRQFDRDHPRLCGEKCGSITTFRRKQGSPPPMRGKALEVKDTDGNIRITPAYAGKRAVPLLAFCRFWDHPRLCGEKPPFWICRIRRLGSPPPMRGKVHFIFLFLRFHWITPAYAGKRGYPALRTFAAWDHPRLCGEKSTSLSGLLCCMGSPPPMRGKGAFVLHV